MRSELLKKYPFIDTVFTEKIFPSKVIITINERQPSLVIDTSKDCVLLDDKGFVLKILNRESDSCISWKSTYSVSTLSGKDVN
jgi:cell division septal protein FtsQ